jgi:hypothetical protein
LALSQLAKAINNSTNQVLELALGFSIIAGNFDLVDELLQKVKDAQVDLSWIFPYHIAISYLDGSIEWCRIFGLLCRKLGTGNFSLPKCYTNALGHTILDNLMIAILKRHTATSPHIVDNSWNTETHFAGDEVDICGRWDPDSNCFRSLLTSGTGIIHFG